MLLLVARLDFKLARALALLSAFRWPTSFPDVLFRFRSLDVDVTAVTSHVAHTTGATDAGAYAESVLSVAAPSQLGPRSRSFVRR